MPIDMIGKIRLDSVTGNHNKDRNKLRRIIIEEFFKEEPGTGTGDNAARYTYYVEREAAGNKVYLVRPANLKNGFDFVIHVENRVFSNGRTNPRHYDISEDVPQKKNGLDNNTWKSLWLAMEMVYLCHDPDDIIRSDSFENLMKINIGLPVDLTLKIMKWFYIEQDIRYWNYSGRYMFWSGIEDLR